jgi:acyl-coenzyme A synthetase/AMP-(fatty) acid ligase
MNASEPIRRNARIAPDAPAFELIDGTTISYGVVERTIDALAFRLRALSLVPGQTVALATNDLYRSVLIPLASARIGVATAPIRLPAALTDVAVLDRRMEGNGSARVVALDDLWPADLLAGDAPPPVALHPGGGAVFAYFPSSGTTAKTPKLVPLSHDVIRNRISTRAMAMPGHTGVRHACFVGPPSVFGLARILRTLWSGSVVIEPNIDANQFASWLVSSRVSHLAMLPVQLRTLIEGLPATGVGCDVGTIDVGGGALPLTTYDLARTRLCANIVCSYGSTETGAISSAPMASMVGRPGAAGYPYPGVEVEVVDADDRPVGPGQEGLLRIRSAQIGSAYVGDAEASAKVFRAGWVYPNDIGMIEPDGLLRIIGRNDDAINRDGIKVHPQAIEDVLMTLANLREVAVFGATDSAGLVVVCAAVVPNGPLDSTAFHARCRERLGARAPGFTMQMRELPRNAMGKVLRGELARIALDASRSRSAAH